MFSESVFTFKPLFRHFHPDKSAESGSEAKTSLCLIQVLFLYTTNRIKRLNQKELTSRPVGLSFHGLDALCLSLLKTAGTTADKKWKERKLLTLFSPFFRGYKHQQLKGDVSSLKCSLFTPYYWGRKNLKAHSHKNESAN